MSSKPSETNRSLGDYIGILAVDVRGFSKHDDTQQRVIVDRLAEVLAVAADRAKLISLWEGRDKLFKAFRGDSYLIGFTADLVAAVVDRFFDSLQSELRRRAGEFRAEGIDFRLRASLHLGLAASFDEPQTDSPTGRIMVEANRMLDAESVRALLDNSDPAVTFVASVLSHTVMENVVEAGHTTRRPSEFVEAPLSVAAKGYSGKGYLRVPAPSGDLLRFGLLSGQSEPHPADEADSAQPEEIYGEVTNSVSGTAGSVLQARDISGGVASHYLQGVNRGITVSGNNNTTAGHSVDQSSGKQEFSGNFHTAGDANFGPSSGRRLGGDTDPKAR
ncbi:hypothetical protein JOF56_010288 [Kibdelosporangium banguiense]|uniref:Adenylate cyclase, class 3 n=1 Tax=Kibdelosporangium banguiense TaxID=1365924 RepID=A0ABS4U0Z3_9PSEU|nr:hypothetical protein [Kibdelosporangium banguiense]MBP2329903.1 hypothetical protein [Kibdelosporangium banguiense]